MEIEPLPSTMKQCFKLNEHIFDSLSLSNNETNSAVLLWNKYQIFWFENFNLESRTPISFTPDFLIAQLKAVNDYLVCLDCNGNMHSLSCTFKKSSQKRHKTGFQLRGVGVAGIVEYDIDVLLTLMKEFDSCFLSLHKVSQDFQLLYKVKINLEFLHKPHEKCILKLQQVSKERQMDLKHLFDGDNTNTNNHNYDLIVMSLDMMTVYGCLFHSKLLSEEINPVPLYSCPSEICDIQIVSRHETYVLIALKIGTIVRLLLRDTVIPEIIHLNSYIHNILAVNNYLLHTDGRNMWLTENIFQQNSVKQKQINIKMVNSFLVNGNNVICVTFSNIIYQFSLEDDSLYTSPSNEYYSAEKMLNSSGDNFKEIERGLKYSKQLAKEADVESNYLLAMALSKRMDLMLTAIQYEVFILENIDTNTTKENISLTSHIQEYFKPESINVLVRVLLKQHKFNVIFSHLVEDLKLHVTLFTEGILLKTTTIAFEKITEEMNFLIPLAICFPKRITIKLNLISSLPGAFDKNQRIWIVLSSKVIVLNYEHLVKTKNNNKTVVHMKEQHLNVYNALGNLANKLYKTLIDVKGKQEKSYNCISFYLKLPESYKDILISETSYIKYLDKHKVNFITNKFSSLNWSLSKVEVSFDVLEEKVKLEILKDDFVGPTLKISCTNDNVGFGMRHFFANIVYGDHENSPEAEWIPQAQYAIVEDLQRAMRNSFDRNGKNILSIADQFHRNVIAALPL